MCDTDLKDALTRMQERFPAPWDVYVGESIAKHDSWLASAQSGDVSIACFGPTPHAAVDAAIKAHDDMVKADAMFKVLKAECEASRTGNLSDVLDARAATDKSGALR